MKRRLALVLPAPTASSWAFAGAVAAADGAGGATVRAFAGAVAATAAAVGLLRGPQVEHDARLLLLLQQQRGLEVHRKKTRSLDFDA